MFFSTHSTRYSVYNMTHLLSTGSALLELSSLLPAVTLITAGLSLRRSSPATMVLTALVMALESL